MPPSIQTYLKAKSYKEAIKNLGLLVGFYSEGEGFAFTPTINTPDKGFIMDDSKVFELRPNCTRKEMANALNKALKKVLLFQLKTLLLLTLFLFIKTIHFIKKFIPVYLPYFILCMMFD